ncbi:MAG: TonB-dependent receptor [Lysobacteraceae bacterium]
MSVLPRAMPTASLLAVGIALAFTVAGTTNAADGEAQYPKNADTTELDPIDLDPIEVRANASESEAIRAEAALTPGGVSVIDGDAFYQRTVNNIADMLRYAPGVWTENSSGGDGAFISIRGSNLDATNYDGNGVKLFQDGLPITAADGNNHNRFQDPLSSRYAIIARGANALTYGASTLGGAIDAITPTARNSDPNQLYINGGDHGLFTGRLSLGGIRSDLDGMLVLEGKHWDGFREHSAQERLGAHANVGWQFSENLDLRLFADYVDNEEELANALTREQVAADRSQANPSSISGHLQWNVETARLAAKGEWRIDDDSRVEFGLSWERQDLYHPIVDKVMVDFDGPGPNPPVEVFSLLKNTEQDVLGGMLRWNLRRGAHDLLLGLNLGYTQEDGGNYRNDAGRRNGLTGIIDNQADSAELFLVDRWRFAPEWTLVYGAQAVLASRDVRTTTVSSGAVRNPRDDYSAINPRLGLIRSLGAHAEAYASASRLFEAPTNFELTDDLRGGDLTLDPMHGTVVEIGLRGDNGATADASRWFWDVSAYHARIRDEILSVDSPTAPGTSLSANIERTTHAGVEALLGASLAFGSGGEHRIEPLLSFTVNAFHFDDDPYYGDNRLPAAPRHALRGELLYRHVGGFFIGPTFDLVGKRWVDFANSYEVDAYELLGLRAGWSSGQWELFAEARNLTDRTWIGNLSVRDSAAPDAAVLQPGAPRSVYAGLRYRF